MLSVVQEQELRSRTKVATLLAVDTGMRRGEILSLQRERLDAYRKVLVVSKSKTAGPFVWLIA